MTRNGGSCLKALHDSADIWNLLDYARIAFQTTYIFNKKLSTFGWLTLMSWLSFLKYLRMFKDLRIFIQLVMESISSARWFIIVLGIMLIGFTNTTRASSDSDFVSSLKHQYINLYGEFDTDAYDNHAWGFFGISTFATTIVMMNLLIAIISDRFEKVMNSI